MRKQPGSSRGLFLSLGVRLMSVCYEFSKMICLRVPIEQLLHGCPHRSVPCHPLVLDPVDEEARCSAYAVVNGAVAVLFDALRDLAIAERGFELFEVQSNFLSPGGQDGRPEQMLPFKKEIVHLPKSSLKRGGFRGLCRCKGKGMRLCEREVAKDKAEFFGKLFSKGFDDRIGGSAGWALIIAVFDQCDERAG